MPGEDRKIFDDYVNEVRKRELSNSQAYDKAVLALSSATLGFSLAAIKLENTECLALMVISWILLILTIISTLLAFVISNKALNESIDKAHKYYIEDDKSAFNNKSESGCAKFSSYLNLGSGICLVLAIILIVYFKTLNI